MKSVTRMLVLATDANSLSASSPSAWPNRSVDRLEVVEIEQQHCDRLAAARALPHQLTRRLHEPRRLNRPVIGSVRAAGLCMRSVRLVITSTIKAVPIA